MLYSGSIPRFGCTSVRSKESWTHSRHSPTILVSGFNTLMPYANHTWLAGRSIVEFDDFPSELNLHGPAWLGHGDIPATYVWFAEGKYHVHPISTSEKNHVHEPKHVRPNAISRGWFSPRRCLNLLIMDIWQHFCKAYTRATQAASSSNMPLLLMPSPILPTTEFCFPHPFDHSWSFKLAT